MHLFPVIGHHERLTNEEDDPFSYHGPFFCGAVLSIAGKVMGEEAARRAYEDAREKAGKDIARPEG